MLSDPGYRGEKGRQSDSTKADNRNTIKPTMALDTASDGKDSTELELERLLFGDDDAFMSNVTEQRQELGLAADYGLDAYEDEEEHGSGEDEDLDLAGLRDEQIFMLDSGPVTGGAQSSLALVPEEETNGDEEDRLAWEDSDDERLTISLASHSRLRKLRYTEAEDIVSGKEYAKRLRQQYERMNPAPGWAQTSQHRKKRCRVSHDLDRQGSEVSVSDEDDMDVDQNTISAQPLAQLLQSAESLVDTGTSGYEGKARRLRPGTIDFGRLPDVTSKQPSAVSSLSFHPSVSPPLLLSSGSSGLLAMHHISAVSSSSARAPNDTNPLLTSLAIPSLAIEISTFHSSGSKIFFAGRRRYFHVWDLPSGNVSRVSRITGNQDSQRSCENFRLSPCGRYMALVGTARKGGGVANILDANTSQWLAQARVEGRNGVADLTWWANGEGLVVLGKGGEVIEYSVAEKRVIARWKDQGAVGSTVVAMGGEILDQARNGSLGPSRWVAIGSQSGIVNIYDRSEWSRAKFNEAPTPKKVLQQLTTPTSHLNFSPDGQMLVMASRWKKDVLRLVHLPSCIVYKNWPTSNTPLGRVTSVAWAANSRLLAVGNEAGKILTFEVRS